MINAQGGKLRSCGNPEQEQLTQLGVRGVLGRVSPSAVFRWGGVEEEQEGSFLQRELHSQVWR